MKRVTFLSTAFMLLLILSVVTSPTMAKASVVDQGTEKVFTVGDLSVKVPTGEVPFYFFWLSDNTTDTYRIGFNNMFEVIDANNNGVYDQDNETIVSKSMIALAQMDWVLSDITNSSSETGEVTALHFNLTGQFDTIYESPNKSTIPDLYIQFRNHIMFTENSTELKFDVVINNYEWTNDNETTLLVLSYKLKTVEQLENEDGSQGPVKTQLQNEERVRFNNGYFDAETTASNTTGLEVQNQVKVSVSLGDGSGVGEDDTDPRIYNSYTHFDGNLTHDPSLGIQSVSDTSLDDTDGSTGSNETGSETLSFSLIGLGMIFVLVPFIPRYVNNKD